MNKNPSEAAKFFEAFLPSIPDQNKSTIVFFPPTLDIPAVANALSKKAVLWGAQNCHFESSGAFTGENSPLVLSQMGARYVLVGHSERRSLFFENDELLSKKVPAIQREGMTPMLCVGETLSQREKGETAKVITDQLVLGLKNTIEAAPFVIAYEPVWAIGTGKVAEPEQAEEAHRILRERIAQLFGDKTAATTPILYGGSVSVKNASNLIALPNIDGFLVGGASLEPSSFATICNCC